MNLSVCLTLWAVLHSTQTALVGLHLKQPCHPYHLENCLLMIKNVTDDHHLVFASTLDALNTACTKLKQGINCVDNYMAKCSSYSQQVLFKDVVLGTRNNINLLCKPGMVQTNYLKFSSCYQAILTNQSDCIQWIDQMANLTSASTTEDNSVQLNHFCCVYSKSISCQINYIQDNCGSEAAAFFVSNLEQMSSSLISLHCAIYLYSKEACDFKDTSKLTQSNVLIVLIVPFLSICTSYLITGQ